MVSLLDRRRFTHPWVAASGNPGCAGLCQQCYACHGSIKRTVENAGEAGARRFRGLAGPHSFSAIDCDEFPMAVFGPPGRPLWPKAFSTSRRLGAAHLKPSCLPTGPYIDCGLDGVALGACTSIELLDTPIESARRQEHGAPNTWWIAKYGNQPRISLDGMSESQRQQLADEFGISDWTVFGRRRTVLDITGLSGRWPSGVKVHPRVAARFRASNAYLPGWYDAACALAERAQP